MDESTQPNDVVLRCSLREQTSSQREQSSAHLVYVVRLSSSQLANENSAIGRLLDESSRFERAKSLANRAPAGTEAQGEFLLVDAISWIVLAREYHVLDLAFEEHRE